jgi:hypothetical protein
LQLLLFISINKKIKNNKEKFDFLQYFVSHKYTNYTAVQETHRRGHEIAVHSIT